MIAMEQVLKVSWKTEQVFKVTEKPDEAVSSLHFQKQPPPEDFPYTITMGL